VANLGSYFEDDKNKIVDLIDSVNTTESLPRPYLGMSQLGEDCARKLLYYFRWVSKDKIDGRVNRIFTTGHNAEIFMIEHLESIGVKTWDTLDSQAGFSAVQNHCRGHSDGMALGVPGAKKTTHLLEFKTSSDKLFKLVKKKGVREEKYMHYCQMALYMYFSKTTRALYMVYNKNTSEYYIERVEANNELAKDLIFKANLVITSENPNDFQKIGSGNASFYKCKFCNYSDVCHNNAKPHKNCRTCKFSDILDDGKWGCSKHEIDDISTENQAKGCGSHDYLEGFVTWED